MAAAYIDAWAARVGARVGRWRASLVPALLSEEYAHGGGARARLTAGDIGDAVLEKLMTTLDEFPGYVRSEGQQRLHSAMVLTLLHAIYGDAFAANMERVLRRLRHPVVFKELLVVAARGAGKTVGVAIFSAAALIAVPNVTISCFGVSRDTSRRLVKLILTLLDSHPEGRDMVVRPTSVDRVRVRGPRSVHSSDERTLTAFAGQTKVPGPRVAWGGICVGGAGSVTPTL